MSSNKVSSVRIPLQVLRIPIQGIVAYLLSVLVGVVITLTFFGLLAGVVVAGIADLSQSVKIVFAVGGLLGLALFVSIAFLASGFVAIFVANLFDARLKPKFTTYLKASVIWIVPMTIAGYILGLFFPVPIYLVVMILISGLIIEKLRSWKK